MPHLHPDIYASAPLQALLTDESTLLGPELAGTTGDHGLHVAPVPDMAPPPLPLLGHWARVHVRGDQWRGDIIGQVAEPLPFADESFGVVVLRHALEMVAAADTVLDEAVRVLAPGGVLALSGVHPLGAWSPWFQWLARGSAASMQQPVILHTRCARHDMEIFLSRRVGRFLPSVRAGGNGLWGGGYVLLARKRRAAVTPLRAAAIEPAVAVPGTLVSGARRSMRRTSSF
jgi:SAM-dependent methyltransferase